MEKKNRLFYSLIIALVIIIVTLFLTLSVYFNAFHLRDYFKQSDYHHWFTWIGTIYIAIITPVYYLLKRRYTKYYDLLSTHHVFGNLLAVMLISLHFSHQISRPPQVYPDLGTGFALYVTAITLVITGFLLKFSQLKIIGRKNIRFIHTGVTLTFYIIIFIHIFHGLAK